MAETQIQYFDFSVNLLKAIIWEYNAAENLQSLLEDKEAWVKQNQEDFWKDWITNVFDLRTANDFGLSVWSIILNQSIYLNNGPSSASKPTFGFGSFRKNFGRGNFTYRNGYSYRLPTETARLLLRLRYFQLVSSGTVPEINRMLKYLFSDYGPVYLIDRHDMTQNYVFGFALPSQIRLLLNNFDILPRPAGVKSTFTSVVSKHFGFDQYRLNFTRGNFGA